MIWVHLSLYRTKTNSNHQNLDDSSHPLLNDANCHSLLDDFSDLLLEGINYRPTSNDSSHPVFEPFHVASKCRQNVDEMAWQIYTNVTVLDHLHLACFAYLQSKKDFYLKRFSGFPIWGVACTFNTMQCQWEEKGERRAAVNLTWI